MKKYNVDVIEKGVVIGPAFKLESRTNSIPKFQSVEKELQILENAINKTLDELNALYEKLISQSDNSEAEIIQAYMLFVEDETFLDSIKSNIQESKKSAYESVSLTTDELVNIFQSMDDDYMAQRANDIMEVSSHILANIIHKKQELPKQPSILITEDLTCNHILNFNKDLILGFVTSKAFSLSHAAILARKNEIPTVFGIDNIMDLVENGDTVLINEDEFIINPDEEVIANVQMKINKLKDFKSELKQFKDLNIETKDGREIQVFANISSSEDLDLVIENNFQGIGLFRTEFFFIDKMHLPTEEEELKEYKTILEKLGGKEVVIRTIDIGSDKPLNFIEHEKEKNPALGKRGVRIYMDNIEIFKRQLRVLLRASCYGNLKIMYPMITSVNEVKFIQKQLKIAEEDLKAEGYDYRVPPQGIMIETPAAALISDELAQLVDFFSIGTNDLTQYTLAWDRENPNISTYLDLNHPALFKLIELCVKNAKKYGIPCSVCGEIASDPEFCEYFLDIGVDTLSIAPNRLLQIIAKIRQI